MQRLSAAVAAGGELAALLVALQEREDRRRQLQERLRQHQLLDLGAIDADGVLRDLRGRLEDWRAVLHDETPRAHKLLKQLIVGRLEMTPATDRSGYAFRGTGTMLPLLAGVVPQSVASPTGLSKLDARPRVGGPLRRAA